MLDRRLLAQTNTARRLLALTIALSLAGGLLTIVQAWGLSQTISRVFLGGATLSEVAGLLGLLLAVFAGRAAAQFGSDVAAGRLAVQVKTGLRAALLDHLAALGPAYAGGQRSGELTVTVVEGVEALDAYFSQYLPQLVVAALTPLLVLAVVWGRDTLSGVVLLLTAPLIPLFMILIGRATEALTHRQYSLLSRLSGHFLDVLQGLTTLKALGQSRAQAGVVARYSERYAQATLGVLRVAFLSALALELVATLSTAIVAVEIGLRLLYGWLDFGAALFILILAPEFYLPLRMLGLRFHAATSGLAAANRVFEVLAEERGGETSPPSPLLGGEGGQRGEPSLLSSPPSLLGKGAGGLGPPAVITFDDVRLTYPDGRTALEGVSFDLRAGQRVALVGPSGAGKSSIASLLLRFVTPTGGEIRVDGVPLDRLPTEAWRAGVGWVPQGPRLFQGTLADNIRLADPDAPLERVREAARLAHLDEFIQSLPSGYNTLVGEGGARLSSGQAQWLVLARAFLKDAPLLILDEPTSHVDPDLEAQLQEATARLMAGRTTLLIAHRLSTVYGADTIIVLDGGRVVEQGRHAELVRQDGLYRRLVVAAGPDGALG